MSFSKNNPGNRYDPSEGIICPECGSIIQSEAAFCPHCGAHMSPQADPDFGPSHQESMPPMPAPPAEAYERRVVTILFADIVGSTIISENIDPEVLLEIMRDAYPCFLDPIQDYGGTIVQIMGDGILAYFGVPLSREDDPERAVLAGLEIVNRIQYYARRLREEGVLKDFHVRVGINTGLVVVGEMNPERHLDYIALGDAVNLAARLQQNAPLDSVLVSHATYLQVRGLFEIQRQEPLQLKGRQQVEKNYLVKQRKPARQRLRKRGIDGVSTAMIGREPELAALENFYDDAIRGGEASLVLISGDPGIGKTRLANEFVDWVTAQPDSPIFLRGRAIPSTHSVPYGVLRNLFARSFGILETDSSHQALEKFRKGTQDFIDSEGADLIGQLIGFDFKISPATQHLLGTASFSEVALLYLKNYFRRLTEKSLFILLEDLHWMDDRTLDLIIDLVSELGMERETRLMILCTARSQFFEHRPKWGEGIRGFTNLKLRRLSRLKSKSLIDAILFQVEEIPDAFYACVVDQSGGNPYFIEELIKMLIDEDVIETQGENWQIKLDKLESVWVPATLTGILQARLDSLPQAEKLVLQRAAIIGRTFWDDLVRALTQNEAEAQKVSQRLEALRDRGLVYHREHSSITGSQEYLFKHALLRDEAYSSVLLKHRRDYHQQVALWIEENAGDRLEEHLSLIAYHAMKGGQSDQAADWYIRAGERALRQCSMAEAKSFFERALTLIKPADTARLWRATLGHDEAVGTLGELDARHQDDQTLLNLAEQSKDDHCLAEAYYRIASQAISEGDNQAALKALDHGLGAAISAGDVSRQALILPLQVITYFKEGDLDAAAPLVESALALAHKSEDPEIIARALNNLAPYYQATGDLSRSVALMHQVVDINQQQGNRLGESVGLINLSYYYLSGGHFETSQKLLEHALAIANRLGAKSCIAYALLNLGLAEWRLNKPQAACETLYQSLEILQALGDQGGLASRQFYCGIACESASDFSEAKKFFSEACDSFNNLGATAGKIEAQAGLARVALKMGDIGEAEKYSLEIIDYLDQEGSHSLELPMLVYLSCARVFEQSGNMQLFKHSVEKGYQEIQDRLERISDEKWRKTFLEAIPENRELLAYYKGK